VIAVSLRLTVSRGSGGSCDGKLQVFEERINKVLKVVNSAWRNVSESAAKVRMAAK
jgi:hypothetical protein